MMTDQPRDNITPMATHSHEPLWARTPKYNSKCLEYHMIDDPTATKTKKTYAEQALESTFYVCARSKSVPKIEPPKYRWCMKETCLETLKKESQLKT